MSRASKPLETFPVRVGTQRLRVAIGGAPQAERTLLLFNGIGASVETMAPFMARFTRTRVVTFDAPGVGESPAPLLPYRPRDIAQLGADVLARLDVKDAHIFGVSWGGAIAQEFAINHPRRCKTLTLAATCAGIVMVPGRLNVLFKMLSPRRYTDPGYLMQIGGDLYGGELRLETELLQLHAESMRSPSRHGYLYQLLATFGWTSWPRLNRVEAPALVLMGDDDPIVPPINGRILASGLRKATLETVDCGHLFVLTRAAQTARRVEAFMDQHTAAAAAD
ncbi:MAG: alpha/beta fold hydrolase [Variovorax sp.]|nr:alpha/beta fold hydrolase [Variovorax sp.]